MSAPQNQSLPQLKKFQKKIKIIPFGTPVPKIKTTLSAANPPYLLFVGRLVKYKGLPFLIKAIKGSNYHLKIAGDGPLKNQLRTQIHKYRLQNQIELLGTQVGNDLESLYRCATAVVLPSINNSEAFGMNLIEALSFGRPLITTEVGSGTSYVNLHNKTGLVVPPRSSQSLRQAIDRILQDTHLAKAFSHQARLRHQSHFTEKSMIDKYADLLVDLTSDLKT